MFMYIYIYIYFFDLLIHLSMYVYTCGWNIWSYHGLPRSSAGNLSMRSSGLTLRNFASRLKVLQFNVSRF